MSNHHYTPDGLAYWKAGSGHSKVLLIMGFGMSGLAWQSQFTELSKSFEVVCYDHLGIGRSHPITHQKINMSTLAKQASQLMEHLGWEQVHIVGVSMGGMIAQHFALKYPERMNTLTLIATSAGGVLQPIPSLRGMKAFWKFNTGHSAEDRLEALNALLFPPDYELDETAEDYEELFAIFGIEIPLKTRLAHIKAIIFHNTKSQLHQLSDEDVLILVPEKDILIHPNESYKLHHQIKNSKILSFPEAGHGLLRQCASEVNQVLLKRMINY